MRAKDTVRTEMKRKRNALGAVEKDALSEQTQRLAISATAFIEAKKVASYISTAKEVSTAIIHSECQRLSKLLVVPYESNRCYHFANMDEHTILTEGSFGIYEPASPQLVKTTELDVAFVPGLAFDRDGRRLGHGAGIFDELLKEFTGIRIGLAFAFQCVEELPEDPHDIRMDCVVNENGFFKE